MKMIFIYKRDAIFNFKVPNLMEMFITADSKQMHATAEFIITPDHVFMSWESIIIVIALFSEVKRDVCHSCTAGLSFQH